MAPNSRPPSLPSIPDISLDLDEKTHLLPELEEALSSAGETSTTFDDDNDFRPSRSHSTHTQNSFHHRRIVLPSRFPSTSSSAPTTYTTTTLPLSPRRYDLTYQVQPLQLPPTQKTIHESWTITYHHPTPRTKIHIRALGITLFRHFGRDEGSILSVVPNTHFSQEELASTVALHEASVAAHSQRHHQKRTTLCKPKIAGTPTPCTGATGGSGSAGGGSWDSAVYAADVEKRIRGLEWKVQDEIYELLSDRVQSSSNAFRRREWRVVVLTEVPGGELTDSPTGFRRFGAGPGAGGRGWFGFGKSRRLGVKATRWPDMPITEYRLVLRGAETKANDQGWGYYNRYSRPWRAADEKEIGEKKRWSSLTGKSEKYVDF
ncbi:hypothetical protein C8A01DRAFT_39889 [Parachaetomium inaequale]|uniref:Uncharacterized protein n=1 Tax=Parachaetomium inaequale TaxID=2588326 RepID=A0AAN6SMA8_9PEZI|nr:hypothetical protein C8A01DRAFT_39889 [Parachaetomium inaequale]